MIPSLQLALLGGALVLIAGAGAALILLHLRTQQEAVRHRVEMVTATHVRQRGFSSAAITRRMVKTPKPLLRQCAHLFGFDPAGLNEGLAWYVVLPITLVVAIIGAELSEALLGSARVLAVLPLWIVLSRSIWSWRRDKRLGLLLMQFPDALAMIVRSVRVGIPVSEAVRVVAREAEKETAAAFSELANELAIGVALETALPQMADHAGLTEYRFFATAITLQSQTGGGLGETLENLADVIRRRIALRARGKALSSEARASGLVLALLPFLVGGLLAFMNPEYMSILVTDPTGRMVLGLAVVLLGVGMLAMRTIINKVLA